MIYYDTLAKSRLIRMGVMRMLLSMFDSCTFIRFRWEVCGGMQGYTFICKLQPTTYNLQL